MPTTTNTPAKRTRKATPAAASPAAPQAAQASTPAIDQYLPGIGYYAGIASDIAGGPTGHLVLLEAAPDTDLTWQGGIKWAQSLGDGARLPTKAEAALLCANLQSRLAKRWCWTGEEYNPSCAWHFTSYGLTFSLHKGAQGGALAVRRLPLQFFNPSVAG